MKVTIPIFKSFYDIECENEQKENIEKISRQINKEITKLAKITNINDEKTLLLLYCILSCTCQCIVSLLLKNLEVPVSETY